MRKKRVRIPNGLWMRITAGLLTASMLLLLGCEAFADEYYETSEETDTGQAEESIPIPFTEDGNGEVQDHMTDDDSKEFYTVKTDDGNTFYLVIDNARSSDNVYMLAQIADDDLESFTGSDAVIDITESSSSDTAENADLTAETADSKKSKSGMAIFLIIVFAALGIYAVYKYDLINKIRGKKEGPESENMEADQNEDDGVTLKTENEDEQETKEN